MGGISKLLSEDETKRSELAGYNAAEAIRNGVKLPKIKDMRVKLEELAQQGIIDPASIETFLQDASAYSSIDPRAQEAEYGALGDLGNIVNKNGLDEQSQAALHQLQEQSQGAERGNREAILQNAAARGIQGSGLELASQMGNQQASATQMANQGFQAAADANARKLAAIEGMGQLGGQIQGQEEHKASAQDAINQFNTANRQSVQTQKLGAEAQNLAEKQRIADTNVGTRNEGQLYNKALNQQDYQNQLSKAQSLSNAYLGKAQNDLAIGEHKTKASDKWSDENLKTDIHEIDPQDFMDKLTGYKYKYKDPEAHGEGEQVGVMAQDLEEVAPQAVNDTPEGKTISYDKMGGPILAAIASLNERLQQLEGGPSDA